MNIVVKPGAEDKTSLHKEKFISEQQNNLICLLTVAKQDNGRMIVSSAGLPHN